MSNAEPLIEDAEPERDPRKCSHVDPESGKVCNGWRVKDDPSGYCAGHLGIGLAGDAAIRAQGTAASAASRTSSAALRRMSTLEAARVILEEEAEPILRNWARQAASDWRAANALITRVYGAPTERIEVGDVSVDPELLRSREAREAAKAALFAKHPGLRAVVEGDGEAA